jgi:hypothetical protein
MARKSLAPAAISHMAHPILAGRLLCRPNREPDGELHGIVHASPTCNDCQRTLTAAQRRQRGDATADIPRRNVPARDVADALVGR